MFKNNSKISLRFPPINKKVRSYDKKKETTNITSSMSEEVSTNYGTINDENINVTTLTNSV